MNCWWKLLTWWACSNELKPAKGRLIRLGLRSDFVVRPRSACFKLNYSHFNTIIQLHSSTLCFYGYRFISISFLRPFRSVKPRALLDLCPYRGQPLHLWLGLALVYFGFVVDVPTHCSEISGRFFPLFGGTHGHHVGGRPMTMPSQSLPPIVWRSRTPCPTEQDAP